MTKNSTRSITHGLVMSGQLEKALRCECCGRTPGSSREIHAHHVNYLDPQDIVWLCAKCHAQLHQQFDKDGDFKDLFSELSSPYRDMALDS
jgi:hypothetical protein